MTNSTILANATPGMVYSLDFDAHEIGGHGATFFTDTLLTMLPDKATGPNGLDCHKVAINGRYAWLSAHIAVTEYRP